ncbi:hypothetical protein [Variovorax sp. UMC13]|uniref:hypothetical protein n=1 Tax=Variovorax sp. UMC13 TaxID=1862326 RepID=UPI0021801276|nr:hypothetical protein [Variovorax sp. UMC13]
MPPVMDGQAPGDALRARSARANGARPVETMGLHLPDCAWPDAAMDVHCSCTAAAARSRAHGDGRNGFTNQQVAALQDVMNRAFENGLCSFSSGNVTCGTGSKATGTGATVIGPNAVANGDDTTAIGNGAQANFAGSVAIGAGARAPADPTTAVGNNAIAAGNNSVALGANTVALRNNSVARGKGSVATRENTVSVGDASAGLTRQITNVAAGTQATDAANLGQVEQAVNAATQDARTYAAKGVAAALAMPQMPALAPGKHWTGVAVASLLWRKRCGRGLGLPGERGTERRRGHCRRDEQRPQPGCDTRSVGLRLVRRTPS